MEPERGTTCPVLQKSLVMSTTKTVTYYHGGTNDTIVDGWVQLAVSPPNVTVQMDVWTSDYSLGGTTVVPLAP